MSVDPRPLFHLAQSVPLGSIVPTLIGLRELAARLRLDERTLRRWIKAKAFPPPLRIGSSFRWREADVLAWLAAREDAA